MRNNWYDNVYTLLLNTEDALAVQHYPLSGSYIDVSNYTHFAFAIFVGGLDTALTVKVHQDTSATQTAGIADVTGATGTIADDDDDQVWMIEVETAKLTAGYRYVTLDMAGPTGNDFGAIVFFGWNARHLPVTQPATFPSGNSVEVIG